jgi:hypothetical protein
VGGEVPPAPQGEFQAAVSNAGCAGLPQTKLALADHPLVPVHLVFDSIPGGIALSEEQTNNFITAFGRMFDTPVRKKFYGLAYVVFVL